MQVCDYQNFAKKFHGSLQPKLVSPQLRSTQDISRPLGQVSLRQLPVVKTKPVLAEARLEKPVLTRLSPYAPALKTMLTRTRSNTHRVMPKYVGTLTSRRLSAEDWLQSLNSNKHRFPIDRGSANKFAFEEHSLSTSRTDLSIEVSSDDECLQDLLELLGGNAKPME